jgi:hypothetical protein
MMYQNVLMGSSGSRECAIGRLTLRGEVKCERGKSEEEMVESPSEEDGEKTVLVLSLMLETSNDVLGTRHSVHLVEMTEAT